MSFFMDISIDISDLLQKMDMMMGSVPQIAKDFYVIAGMGTHNYLQMALGRHMRTGDLQNALVWGHDDMGAIVAIDESIMSRPHAQVFFTGSKPSPGRYIPAIGKRYKKETIAARPGMVGMHPGTPSHMDIWRGAIDYAAGMMNQWLREAIGLTR